MAAKPHQQRACQTDTAHQARGDNSVRQVRASAPLAHVHTLLTYLFRCTSSTGTASAWSPEPRAVSSPTERNQPISQQQLACIHRIPSRVISVTTGVCPAFAPRPQVHAANWHGKHVVAKPDSQPRFAPAYTCAHASYLSFQVHVANWHGKRVVAKAASQPRLNSAQSCAHASYP